MCTYSVAVYVFAGHQLELAFETITSPEFLKKSFGVIIALLFVHIILLVLLLRIQFKPRRITASYLEAVRASTAFQEINGYIAMPAHGDRHSTDTAVNHLLSANAVRLSATGDVVREMFSNRMEKLRKNRISRVKGWPFRLGKLKIVSRFDQSMRLHDGSSNLCVLTMSHLPIVMTDGRGAHVLVAGPDRAGGGTGVAIGRAPAPCGDVFMYAAL
jgi:preprotein translocase subunit SecG